MDSSAGSSNKRRLFFGQGKSASRCNRSSVSSVSTSTTATTMPHANPPQHSHHDWLTKYQVDVPLAVAHVVTDYLPLPPGYQPSKNDVVCGRGRGYYNCTGNVRFRNLVKQHVELYASKTAKSDKTAVLEVIVKQVKEQHNGKFVKQLPAEEGSGNAKNNGRWCELGDVATREKVGNAMREALSARNTRKVTGSVTNVTSGLRSLFQRANSGSGEQSDGTVSNSSSLKNIKDALNYNTPADADAYNGGNRQNSRPYSQSNLSLKSSQRQLKAFQQLGRHSNRHLKASQRASHRTSQRVQHSSQDQEQQEPQDDFEMMDVAGPLPDISCSSSSMMMPLSSSSLRPPSSGKSSMSFRSSLSSVRSGKSGRSAISIFGRHVAGTVDDSTKDHSLAMSEGNNSSWLASNNSMRMTGSDHMSTTDSGTEHNRNSANEGCAIEDEGSSTSTFMAAAVMATTPLMEQD